MKLPETCRASRQNKFGKLVHLLVLLKINVCVKWIQTLQASSQTTDYCEHGNKTSGSAAGRQSGPAQWRTVWYSATTTLNRNWK